MDRNQRRTSAPTMSLRLMIQRVGLGSLRITPLAKEAPPTSPAKADVQADVLFYAVPLEVDVPGKTALIAEALTGMRTRSCIIDGEAVARDDNGLASFERIRYRQHDGDVFLYAFDLIEFNGDDMRRDPLEVRKATLRSMVAKVGHLRPQERRHLCHRVSDGRRHPCGVFRRMLARHHRPRRPRRRARRDGRHDTDFSRRHPGPAGRALARWRRLAQEPGVR